MSGDLPSLESVFAQAIELASAEERAAFLDEVCRSDPELRLPSGSRLAMRQFMT